MAIEGRPRSELLGELRARIETGRSLLLTGPAGVGKTEVARRLRAQLDAAGWSTFTIDATPAVQPVSFGAVHALLTAPATEGVTLLNQAIAALAERARGRRQLVVVDDLHALDADSLALVDRLARDDTTTLVLTARATHLHDQRLSPLWKDEIVDLVRLGPLTRAEADQLAADVLEGRVAPSLLDANWELTRGNPLFIRELLLGARGQGRVACDETGAWVRHGQLATTTRLFGIISDRLSTLTEHERDALVTIACSAPISMLALDAVTDTDELLRLERDGFVVIDEPVDQPATARMAHPMIGEVLREGSSPVQRRALLGELGCGMLQRPGLVDADNRQRALLWALDAGRVFDHDHLLPAAERALFRFDARTAALLAAPALELTPSPRAAQILCRSLFLTNRHDEAAAAAAKGLELATDEGDRCVLLVAWADNEMHGRADPGNGILRLEHELPSFTEQQWRAEIEMRIAVGRALLGEPLATIDDGAAHADDQALPLAARVHLTAGLVYAMTMTGDVGPEFQRRLAEGRSLTADEQEYWIHHLLLELLGCVAELLDAEVARPLERAAAVAATAHDVTEAGGWQVVVALAEAVGGAAAGCSTAGANATASLDASDPFGVWLWVHGIAALGHARSGDLEAAQRAIEQAAEHDQANQGRLAVFVRTAEGWVRFQRGDRDGAVRHLVEAADQAAAEEHFVFAAFAAHEVVRLGSPDAVVDRLRDWSERARSSLLDRYLAHAEARIDHDADALHALAEAFAADGAHAIAAEAFAAAAECGTAGESLTRRLRAQSAAADVGWTTARTLADVDFPLSERELEVALAAASGKANKEIATELFVSARTVGNHLQAVYRKLGISARADLFGLLGPAQAATTLSASSR